MLEGCYYRLLGSLRLPLLLAILLVTALLAVPASRVGIEQDNASMAASDPQQQRTYRHFQQQFGSDDLLLLGLHDPELTSPAGLARLAALTGTIERLDGIRRVFSLSNARIAVAGPFGAQPASLLPPTDADDFAARLAARLEDNPRLAARLLSADRRTAALLAVPADDLRGEGLQRLVTQLRDLGKQLADGQRLYLTGVPVQKADVARAIQNDQRTIIPLSVLLLALLLLVLFRRPMGVILPLLVMGTSLVWTIGLYSLAGFELNTITALLPPVIMVLAVATSVHLLHGWLELGGERGEVRSLLAHRMADLFIPCLLTALTTSIGLFSLAVCDIPAVRRFGIFAGIGSLLAFSVAAILVPVILSWCPLPRRCGARPPRPLRRSLRRISRLVLGWPAGILLGAGLVSLLALPGIPRIHNNTDLVRFFHPGAPLLDDTLALDRTLGGVETIELVITPRDGRPIDTERLQRLAVWQRELEALPEVSGSFGLPDLLTELWRADRPDADSALPTSEGELLELYDLLAGIGDGELVSRLVTADRHSTRLGVQLHLLGSADASRLARELLAAGAQRLGPGVQLEATGGFLLMSGDSNRLVSSLLRSFLLSLVLVLTAIYAHFRSWRLLLVALAPNLLPILWTAGLMGWCGIDLSTGTAMIAAVTIGLVVDDTIHFLHRYRRERRGYAQPALVRTTLGVGPALVTSTLVLTLGFWIGIFGSFRPTSYFSLLTGATLLGALVCDLLVLPAGLLLFGRARQRLKPLTMALAMLLCCTVPALSASLPDELLDDSSDLPVREALLPAQAPHVGTLRLLKRGQAVVLQTDLETTLLRRVLAKISAAEQRRWPAGTPQNAAMLEYLEALADAGAVAEARVRDIPADGDRRRRLQIEFIAASPRCRLAFYLPDGSGGRSLHSSLIIPRRFCLAEISSILGEQLQLDDGSVKNILLPLLPTDLKEAL